MTAGQPEPALSPAPTFLPLTASATDERGCDDIRRAHATAISADGVACECWVTLLADIEALRSLSRELRRLVEAVTDYAGPAWWFSDGSGYRRRVTESQLLVEEAMRTADGEGFAEAFGCFDHAVATAVVCAPRQVDALAGMPAPRTSPQVHGTA